MSTDKNIEKICCIIVAVTIIITVLFMNGEAIGIKNGKRSFGYEERLFDKSRAHSIDVKIEDEEFFFDNAAEEKYVNCTVTIDGETFKNTAIRVRDKSSAEEVKDRGDRRFNFKIEFDKYDSKISYYGLDKLNLQSGVYDETLMKEYLTFGLMEDFGVAAPLCSFASLSINGEDFGLYLAQEAVSVSFLKRNYGSRYGNLYKPKIDEETGSIIEAALIYKDDKVKSYDGIFKNEKTKPSKSEKKALIASLKNLNEGVNIEKSEDIENIIKFTVVNDFVLNQKCYTGMVPENYYLSEREGMLNLIPGTYEFAFGGFEDEFEASGILNNPIDMPFRGCRPEDRPLVAGIFADKEYTELYYKYYEEFVEKYFENGGFETIYRQAEKIIDERGGSDPDNIYELFIRRAEAVKNGFQ